MVELIRIILLDYRVLAYEAKPKPKLGTVLNVWAQEKQMNKLFEDKMSKSQWKEAMLMRYDTMPPWWWDNSKRDEAYKNYLENKSYD